MLSGMCSCDCAVSRGDFGDVREMQLGLRSVQGCSGVARNFRLLGHSWGTQ